MQKQNETQNVKGSPVIFSGNKVTVEGLEFEIVPAITGETKILGLTEILKLNDKKNFDLNQNVIEALVAVGYRKVNYKDAITAWGK